MLRNKIIYRALNRGYYPTVLVLVLVLIHFYLFKNISLRWMFLAEICIFLSLVVLEKLMPYDQEFPNKKTHLRVDILYFLLYVTLYIFPGVGNNFVHIVIGLTIKLATFVKLPVPLVPEVEKWNPWVAFFVALIVAEFGTYWSHRLIMHSKFWIAHRTHHSSLGVYTMMFFRQHFLDSIVGNFSHLFLLVIIGFNFKIILSVIIFFYVCSQVAHSNVDLDNPWIGKILLTNKVHRVHHIADNINANSNFGICHLFWDYLGRTHRAVYPKDIPFGLYQGEKYPVDNFWGQLLDPLIPKRFKKTI